MTNQARRKARLLAGMIQMTPLRLHGDLSYCKVEGHLIFLDIRNDRYFRLADRMESALIKYLEGGDGSDINIPGLIERKILIGMPDDVGRTPYPPTPSPTRSAMEEAGSAERANIRAALDALAVVCSTHLRLKTRSLKYVLDRLVAYRQRRTSQPSTSGRGESQVLDASAIFRSARPYVPINTCCLLDSIAMVKFLAKRRLHADLVFGVTGTPFSAHCWVQHGTFVLNDTVGHALAHTPIRVI